MFRRLWKQLVLTWKLLGDPRVALWMKFIPIAAILYLFIPLDVFPDWYIGLGQIEDTLILIGSMFILEAVMPSEVLIDYKPEAVRKRKRKQNEEQADSL